MNGLLANLSHYGDILAIPFFLLLIIYFVKKESRTSMENLLLFFSVSGFILDILYTILFIYKKS
jgi:hypothetical protein